jgi:hypothetical protein
MLFAPSINPAQFVFEESGRVGLDAVTTQHSPEVPESAGPVQRIVKLVAAPTIPPTTP